MNSLPLAVQVFLFRALFSASVVYLLVALFVVQPTHWLGVVHCVWAGICVVGSSRAFKAAKQREAQTREQDR